MPAPPPDLETVRDDLEFLIERFARLRRPEKPDFASCDELASQSIVHRRYGIVRLLTELDGEAFFEQLRRSAERRLELLQWTRGLERQDDLARFISGTAHRLNPFADALAAGDLELGAKLAAASQAPFDARHEYEDDHHYFQLLAALVSAKLAPDAAVTDHLARFEAALEGEPSCRLDACRALLSGSAPDLEAALEAMIAEHEARFRKKREGILADPQEYATERFVLVEGLALKVLAARMGLPVPEESRFMPRQAYVLAAP
jgi:hypothetical protein